MRKFIMGQKNLLEDNEIIAFCDCGYPEHTITIFKEKDCNEYWIWVHKEPKTLWQKITYCIKYIIGQELDADMYLEEKEMREFAETILKTMEEKNEKEKN